MRRATPKQRAPRIPSRAARACSSLNRVARSSGEDVSVATRTASPGQELRFALAPEIVLIALLAAPLLVVTVPPLADLPAHLGRYYIESKAGAAAVGNYFAATWQLSGNLGVDGIVYVLAKPLGVEL